MKLKVTIQEVITYENEVEIEMTQAEYKAYLKGDLSVEEKMLSKAEDKIESLDFSDKYQELVEVKKV